MTTLDPPSVEPSAPPAVPAPRATLAPDERAELLRLRQEVQQLHTAAPPSRRRFRWRSLLAVVLIVLGCVLAPVAGVSVWVHNQVSNTDRFVRTMSPLIDDPDVQARLTDPQQHVGCPAAAG